MDWPRGLKTYRLYPKIYDIGNNLSKMLPLEVQTLYAEALERARVMDLDGSFGHLSGNFGRKKVGTEQFWYFRTSEGKAPRCVPQPDLAAGHQPHSLLVPPTKEDASRG